MRKSSASIRKAGVSDCHVGLPLFEKLYHGDIGPDFEQTFGDYVRSEDGVVLFAKLAGKMIGILVGSYHLDIDWEGKTAKIDAIIVDENHRKMGVGRKLVQHFIAMTRRNGCKAVKSRINRENAVAQKFHRSLGFEEAETYEYFLDFEHPRKS